ncbi:MAG: hypothetical protein RLZZ577_108 [Bacteroidota bacterium]|jgi:hypothetical protein
MSRTYFVGADAVYVSPNWTISSKINARSTLNIEVVDKLSATITNGKSFTIYNGVDVLFQGIIVNIDTKEIYPSYLQYSLSIVDNSAIADKRIIAKVYENELAGDIVKDLITVILGEEGITEGTIQDGITIEKAVFNYIKVSQALDYIKNVTGYIWNIDNDKKLHFFARSTNTASWELTDLVQHSKFTQKTEMDTYRNTQFVRGGKGKTATQTNETPSPKPDGESRNFVLRFPVAEAPTIEINLNSGGWVAIATGDVGINGLNTGKKWYYSYGSNILTQDSTQTVLATVDAIRVTYIGLRNLFTKVENLIEIDARALIESNTGIYENMAIEKSITESAQALQFGNGLLEKFAEIKDKVTFSTEVAGLEAGQLLTITKTLYSISDTFLIESINIRPRDNLSIEYTVTCLDGVCVGGWEEFFKTLIKDSRDFSIQENEVLILLNNVTETGSIEGSIDVDIFNALYPANDLYPANNLYPNNLVASEVTLSD